MGKPNFFVFLRSFFAESVIESVIGDTQVQLEVVYVNGKKVLNTPNANYSYGHLHRIFQEVFDKLNFGRRYFNDVLILGFGAGSVMSILQNDYKMDSHVTGVEIDKMVIALAEKHFDLHDFNNLTLKQEDAFDFISNNKREYDLIVIDTYIDNIVPKKFESEKFIEKIRLAMKKKGIIMFNKFIFDFKSKNEAESLVDKFERLLGFTKVIKLKNRDENWILVYENK